MQAVFQNLCNHIAQDLCSHDLPCKQAVVLLHGINEQYDHSVTEKLCDETDEIVHCEMKMRYQVLLQKGQRQQQQPQQIIQKSQIHL